MRFPLACTTKREQFASVDWIKGSVWCSKKVTNYKTHDAGHKSKWTNDVIITAKVRRLVENKRNKTKYCSS